MATHGKARERTIKDLQNRKPFKRAGFAMSAMEGGSSERGRMPEPYFTQYRLACAAGIVSYTVMSYGTPIAWCTSGGQTIIPEVSYSMTTSHHQSLCRVYLA